MEITHPRSYYVAQLSLIWDQQSYWSICKPVSPRKDEEGHTLCRPDLVMSLRITLIMKIWQSSGEARFTSFLETESSVYRRSTQPFKTLFLVRVYKRHGSAATPSISSVLTRRHHQLNKLQPPTGDFWKLWPLLRRHEIVLQGVLDLSTQQTVPHWCITCYQARVDTVLQVKCSTSKRNKLTWHSVNLLFSIYLLPRDGISIFETAFQPFP